MTGDAMRPHPGGLAGRVVDALDDLAALRADPNAHPVALWWAEVKATALVAALNAEDMPEPPRTPR